MANCVIDMVQQHLRRQSPAADTAPEWTGFQVPPHLRSKSPARFQNMGLQLGLHHRTSRDSPTEIFKFDIARVLHSKLASRKSSWDQFARLVVGDVNRARGAYSESSVRFTDEAVYYFLALDALFIVVLFKFVNGRSFFLEEFRALAGRMSEVLNTISKADFFLIENQVPMYLLQSAIRQLCEIDEETVARRVFDPTFQIESKVEEELEMVLYEAVLHLYPFTYTNAPTRKDKSLHEHLVSTYPLKPFEKSLLNCQHLLDCVYRVMCSHSLPYTVEPGVESSPPLQSIPSATRLASVGICVVGSVPNLRDVKLNGAGYVKNAKLQLPKVVLYDYSESAFCNLALHEQRVSGGLCGDLRCYLQCMASLCINESDLQVLSEEGVINNHVGDNALLGMWDRTLRGVFTPFPSQLWVRLYHDIHQHRTSRVKRWRAEFWALFFAKPWTLVSVLAAIILLFLTAAQAWFTVHPPQ